MQSLHAIWGILRGGSHATLILGRLYDKFREKRFLLVVTMQLLLG